MSSRNFLKNKEDLLFSIINKEKGYAIVDLPQSFLNLVFQKVLNQIAVLSKEYKFQSIIDAASFFKQNTEIQFSRNEMTVNKEIIKKEKNQILKLISEFTLKPNLLVNDDLYFRIVRKNKKNEKSIVHRDIYFHNIVRGWEPNPNILNLKLWIPLYLENNYALGVIEGSHLDKEFEDCNYLYENGEKTKFTCKFNSSHLQPLEVKVGQALIFPSTLIHGSVENNIMGNMRISSELTIGYDLKKYLIK